MSYSIQIECRYLSYIKKNLIIIWTATNAIFDKSKKKDTWNLARTPKMS